MVFSLDCVFSGWVLGVIYNTALSFLHAIFGQFKLFNDSFLYSEQTLSAIDLKTILAMRNVRRVCSAILVPAIRHHRISSCSLNTSTIRSYQNISEPMQKVCFHVTPILKISSLVSRLLVP